MTTPNRRSFLKYAGAGAGALTLGGLNLSALAATSPSTKSKEQDIAIMQYALVLEYLEAEFYTAFDKGGFATKLKIPRVREYAKQLAAHESAHVKLLQDTIRAFGATPGDKPKIDFSPLIPDPSKLNDEMFLQLAIAFEPVGTRAFLGQAPSVQSAAVLNAAASIMAVEANHMSGIQQLRAFLGYNKDETRMTDIPPQSIISKFDVPSFNFDFSPMPAAFLKPLTMEQTLAIVKPLLPDL